MRHRPASSTPSRPLRLRLALWWLAFALLSAQGLARVHQVLHAPGGGATLALSSPLSGLFHGHEGGHSESSLACQALDHLASDLATAWALPTLPAAIPAAAPAAVAGRVALPRFAAAYLARAPPAVV